MPEQLLLERLTENLTRLRLARIRESLPELLKAAEGQAWSYAQLLDALFEEEVASREQTRIEHALKGAGLPYLKTLDEFDFAFQPGLNRQQILGLFDLTFLARKENLVLLGPPGVGKTHLAVALAVKAAQAGQTIQFTTLAELIGKLRGDRATGRMGRSRHHYTASLVRIPVKAATRSERNRPAVPVESGHPARSERSDGAGSFTCCQL